MKNNGNEIVFMNKEGTYSLILYGNRNIGIYIPECSLRYQFIPLNKGGGGPVAGPSGPSDRSQYLRI